MILIILTYTTFKWFTFLIVMGIHQVKHSNKTQTWLLANNIKWYIYLFYLQQNTKSIPFWAVYKVAFKSLNIENVAVGRNVYTVIFSLCFLQLILLHSGDLIPTDGRAHWLCQWHIPSFLQVQNSLFSTITQFFRVSSQWWIWGKLMFLGPFHVPGRGPSNSLFIILYSFY